MIGLERIGRSIISLTSNKSRTAVSRKTPGLMGDRSAAPCRWTKSRFHCACLSARPHGQRGVAKHIKPAADFILRHGPATGQERWEEKSGYSPSTIAAEIAGLVCAAQIARLNGDSQSRTCLSENC